MYRPRRPRASPLYGLLDRRFRHLSLVYDQRFARTYGPWRAVVPTVGDRFLACGILEHGFARIRCDACAHEYLLAFSCKSRYFCPSCHAKRLAHWTLGLGETLLSPVPYLEALEPIGFLARLLTHIPDPGQVMTRYYGWYASRTRGTRARLASDGRRPTADG